MWVRQGVGGFVFIPVPLNFYSPSVFAHDIIVHVVVVDTRFLLVYWLSFPIFYYGWMDGWMDGYGGGFLFPKWVCLYSSIALNNHHLMHACNGVPLFWLRLNYSLSRTD